MTRKEKTMVNRMLRERYHDCQNITYGDDHSVCCTVSDFPGSAKSQRVFAGWDGELLEEAKRREEA